MLYSFVYPGFLKIAPTPMHISAKGQEKSFWFI